MKKLTLVAIIFVLAQSMQAQGIGFGFKIGMTQSKFDGPSEQANGNDLESNANAGGFMVGAIFKYNITELAGIKAELLYNQKGTKYNFTGEAYRFSADRLGHFQLLSKYSSDGFWKSGEV